MAFALLYLWASETGSEAETTNRLSGVESTLRPQEWSWHVRRQTVQSSSVPELAHQNGRVAVAF